MLSCWFGLQFTEGKNSVCDLTCFQIWKPFLELFKHMLKLLSVSEVIGQVFSLKANFLDKLRSQHGHFFASILAGFNNIKHLNGLSRSLKIKLDVQKLFIGGQIFERYLFLCFPLCMVQVLIQMLGNNLDLVVLDRCRNFFLVLIPLANVRIPVEIDFCTVT
jgi:hypothetical protein